MPCPKCNSEKIVKRGTYKIKRFVNPQQRLSCNDCNHKFINKNTLFRKRIPFIVREKVRKAYFIRDRHQKKSVSEIAIIFNIDRRSVLKIIKEKE